MDVDEKYLAEAAFQRRRREEEAAISRLHEAAPDLLAALQEAMDWLLPADPGSSRYAAWDACRKAVRKATEKGSP